MIENTQKLVTVKADKARRRDIFGRNLPRTAAAHELARERESKLEHRRAPGFLLLLTPHVRLSQA